MTPPTTFIRIAGPTRYDTAVALARASFSTSPTVFLATGGDFPDALAAGAVAGATGAPLLLTRSDRLLEAVAEELVRLAPDRVVVVGSPAAISTSVEAAVQRRTRARLQLGTGGPGHGGAGPHNLAAGLRLPARLYG